MASEIAENVQDKFTSEELKVYDRQIRLWGLSGQNALRKINVLVIGMQGLGAEVAKNLILSGINSITLKDDSDVSRLDHCSQFLIPPDSQEKNRAKASLSAAQKLNPNVKVMADTTLIEDEDCSFVSKYDLVIATGCSPKFYKKLNEACRNTRVKLFIGDVYGLFGYFFQDVIFDYLGYGEVFPDDQGYIEVSHEKDGLPLAYYLTSALLKFQYESNRKLDIKKREEDITNLKSVFRFKENAENVMEKLDNYYRELFCELSPTTSIIGATIAQVAMDTVMNGTAAIQRFNHYNVYFYDHIELNGQFHLIST